MLSRESVTMREGRDNPLTLSPKTPCRGQTDRRRSLERLRADWEAEKQRTQRARGHLSVELRHLRELAEKEQQKATRELAARRGAQKDGPSHRHWGLLSEEADGKGGGRFTEKEVFCLCGGETHRKLQHLLLTLDEKINGKQAVYELHHRQESELEKAVFLCHLLEAHGRVLQRRQRAGHPGYVSLSRKTTRGDGGNSCRTRPLQTYSGAVLHGPQTAFRSLKNKPKPAQRDQLSGSKAGVCAADPCTADAAPEARQSGPLRICPRDEGPHAGWDEQPPYDGESSGSDQAPPSTCMDRNMEVSYLKFANTTHGS